MEKNNQGVNMTKEDIKATIEKERTRLSNQQERMDKLEQTMQNTCHNIEQLEYTLRQLELAESALSQAVPQHRPRKSRFIPHEHIRNFFAYISRVFDRIQHRLHYTPRYTWFCIVLCSRYTFESGTHHPHHGTLTPATVLGYFKRERAR